MNYNITNQSIFIFVSQCLSKNEPPIKYHFIYPFEKLYIISFYYTFSLKTNITILEFRCIKYNGFCNGISSSPKQSVSKNMEYTN